jgi:uncharacterized protein with PIN domain
MGLTDQYPLLSVRGIQGRCSKCQRPLFDVLPRYLDEVSEHCRHRDELYCCAHCGQQFILRHDFYDVRGHLIPVVLSTDPNDPDDQWYHKLSTEQRAPAIEHMATCTICQKRLAAETVSDAWFRDLLGQMRQTD